MVNLACLKCSLLLRVASVKGESGAPSLSSLSAAKVRAGDGKKKRKRGRKCGEPRPDMDKWQAPFMAGKVVLEVSMHSLTLFFAL